MVIIIYVNQCQKCCSLLTLSYLNGLIPALRQISVGCCFCIDFFAAAKMEANLNILYLSSSIQTCRNQRTMPNDKMWKTTHACPNVYPWYCVVIDLMCGNRSGEINQEKEQTEEEKTESAEWLK